MFIAVIKSEMVKSIAMEISIIAHHRVTNLHTRARIVTKRNRQVARIIRAQQAIRIGTKIR